MNREGGFALVSALWLLVLLSAVSLEFSLRARDRRLAAANAVELAKVRAVADGAIGELHARLVERVDRVRRLGARPEDVLDPWRNMAPSVRDTGEIDGVQYRLTVRDLGSRLNLNHVEEEELRRFFRALQVDYGAADRLSQAIADWRDGDDLRRARGAEREDYLREGEPMLPTNRPFVAIAELRYVRGMTSQLYRRVEPLLTVRGTGQVNLNTAPEPVLTALSGLSPEAVATIIEHQRARRPLRSLDELALELSAGSRAELQRHQVSLAARVVFESREVEALAHGWMVGTPTQAHVRALFVRGGSAVFRVWKGAE